MKKVSLTGRDTPTLPRETICAAVGCNQSLNKSTQLHCSKHRKLYQAKYLEYKKVSKKIERYLFNPLLLDALNREQLLMVATQFHIAAHLRKEYQACAIKPERRDEGHNKFIISLLNVSKTLLEKLEPLDNESSEEEEYCDSFNNETSVCLLIKEDVINLEKELQNYIQQNELLLKECEDKFFVFVNLVNSFLYPFNALDLHSSDLIPIQTCENIERLLEETIRAYVTSQGYFDFKKIKHIIRPPCSKIKCLRSAEKCIVPGVCPADYFTKILDLINHGSIKHPFNTLRETEYPGELMVAIKDIILYERSNDANKGYLISFVPSDSDLLMEVFICPLEEIPPNIRVLVHDKKKFKVVNLNKRG